MSAKLITLALTVIAATMAAAKRKIFFIMFLFLKLLMLIVKCIFQICCKGTTFFGNKQVYFVKKCRIFAF
jgi:hypothetical protein